jgi:hypothetical protein
MTVMTNILPFGIFKFDLLALCPPAAECFEEPMGVKGEARFIAFWGQGNSMHWADGMWTAIGDFRPWEMWRWTVGVKILGSYCFGHGHGDADHYLILDRLNRRLYAAPILLAQETLRRQFSEEAEHMADERSQEDAEDFGDW